jgi:hypothetical protein
MPAVTVVTHVEKRSVPPAPVRPPLWMHLEDKAAQGYIRSCAPCPAVWVLKDDPHALLDEQWQYYQVAINYLMTLANIYLLLDDHLAFANRTGWPSLDNPGDKQDWIFRRNLNNGSKPPALDKVRTCSRSVMTGKPVYSALMAVKLVIAAVRETRTGARSVRSLRQDFRTVITAPNLLEVHMFDSRQPPLLKPGRSYPSRVQDVNPDDYLYMPRTHPWMFLTATIVNRSGEVVQFPRGAVYPWTGDNTSRSFLPHIYHPGWGPVRYDLGKLWRVPDNQPIPSPYRSAS